MQLNYVDIIVLCIYFVALTCAGLFALFTSNRGTVHGYFLAGRFITWIPIGASLFASNIGSEHFIGLAGSGAAAGIAVGAFELNASLLLQLLGWVFLPVYIASSVCTLPEYMKKRFGGTRIHIYLAVLSIILYIFTKISVNLYSGSLFLSEALGWADWLTYIVILSSTALITITGGLTAVLYTDTLQFFIMIIGAIILAIMSYLKVGGFANLIRLYGQAISRVNASTEQGTELLVNLSKVVNETGLTSLSELAQVSGIPTDLKCSLPSSKAFILLRGISDPDMPWLGFILGQTPASIWYWCTDQMMVQRALAAKGLSHAQGATLMAGLIKQLPLFIMVIPGMISRVLYPDEIGCLPGDDCMAVCGHRNGCSNLAYLKLVLYLMPAGLKGLMLAVMLAATISDLTSIFNSASTLLTVDIYLSIRKKARDIELVIVGRIFVVVLVILSIAWIPVMRDLQGSQLFTYIQAVSAYFAPPVAAVYLCAVLIKRCTERGAFSGLIYGFVVGFIRMVLIMVYREPICGEVDTRPFIVGKIHYMYFAIITFVSTAFVVCVISLTEIAPTRQQLSRVTYCTAWDTPTPPEAIHLKPKVDATGNSCTTMIDTDGDQLNHNGDINATNTSVEIQLEVNSDTSSDASSDAVNSNSTKSKIVIFTKNICLWLGGCNDHPCPSDRSNACCCLKTCVPGNEDVVDEPSLHYQPMKTISLKQNPKVRLGLRIGLVSIITLSIFSFIFFSVYFGEIEIGPMPVVDVPTDSPSNEYITKAIHLLYKLRLIKIL